MNTCVFIRDYLSHVMCFRFIFRVNKHVLMYIVSFYDDLSMQSCHNVLRSMMTCKINTLKPWWKYNSHVFIRNCLSHKTCFRFIFRVDKHVPMYILSFYDDLSIQSHHNVLRFMMMCKINMLKSWWKYNSYVFIRKYLSHKTCFRFIFRVDKHVPMYIVSFYDDLSIQS